MENPNRARIEDDMLLTMFDPFDASKDTTQDTIDERKHHTLFSFFFWTSFCLGFLPFFALFSTTFMPTNKI